MIRKYLVHCLYAGATGLMILPAAASAQQAIINTTANLRAGPAPDYPVVALLQNGTPVTVMGCVGGYSWCDVTVPNLRGWVYGGSLSYPYQGGNVPILTYGATIGLPIVTFSLGSYWDNYYRGRPWYNDRARWEHHAPPRPGPSRPGYRPPPGHGGPGGPGHRPPNIRPPGPGARPPGGGRPPEGARPPGGGRPPGGRPPGAGGGRPPGGDHGGRPGGGGRPSGGHGGGGHGGGHGGGGPNHPH